MLAAGTKLGAYEILAPLGAGGMGEVYRARDTQLKREVAIKILPSAYSSDRERLLRFQQEAEAAAALNHPNILSIHHIGRQDGNPYIVSELLQGQTLRERLSSGPLSVRSTVEYATGIAQGLTAAHEKGIVHRDLKPENIFITTDGHIKILDFGLAKLTEPNEESGANAPTVDLQTDSGKVLGTVGYMSPEQVRGQPAHSRSDIFAFGAILYEMLSGNRAFRGETPADTQSAILREQPPDLSDLNRLVPPALDRIVRHCLEKSPNQRFQSARDLGYALETISGIGESSGSGVAPIAATKETVRLRWIGVALAIAVAGTVLAWWLRPSPVPQIESIVQLTNDGEPKNPFAELLATDGSRVYFAEKYEGRWRLAQVSVSGGQVARVATQIPLPFDLSMAPDSSGLLVSEEDPTRPLWFQPLPAGDAHRLGNLEGQEAVFSPDGKQIVYVNRATLYIADHDGSNSRKIADLPGYAKGLAVSPDFEKIRFNVWENFSESIWEVNSNGTNLHQLPNLSKDFAFAYYGRWTPDGRYFLFQGYREGFVQDVWAISERTGLLHGSASLPIQLTKGPLSCGVPIPSRDGKQIFARCSKSRGELVRYERKSQRFVPFLDGISVTDVKYSRDGHWLVYLSYPERTLWRMGADGKDRLQLTYAPIQVSFPSISPDGSKVIFTVARPKSRITVYTVSMTGGTPQKIADDDARTPNWSPDGNFVAFLGLRPGMHWSEANASEIRILDLVSGKISVVPESRNKARPIWTSQATLVAQTESSALVRYDFKTQSWSEFAAGPFSECLSPDERYLYCTTMEPAAPRALRIRLSDGRAEPLVDLAGLRLITNGSVLGLTPDSELLFTRDIGTHEIYALNVRWP